jgi:mono/diheme cytochrome c family protein
MRALPAIVLITVLLTSLSFEAQTPAAPSIALPPGDAARGKAIFESSKGNCLSCHRVSGTGSLFGPDLSNIGSPPAAGGGGRGGAAPGAAGGARGAAGGANPAGGLPPAPGAPAPPAAPRGQGGQANAPAVPNPQLLAQSILDPNAVVSVQNRYVTLKMRDGKTTTGKLLNLDTFFVQIFDSAEKLQNISKENVREMTMTSPMPSYRDKLTTQELSDVVSYLLTLKVQ